jgi:hypothetical protein
MSDFLNYFSKNKKQSSPEDEEAFEEQIRVFNQAKEIIKKQQIEQQNKQKQDEARHGGIDVIQPYIDISQYNIEEVDRMIKKREKLLIEQSPLSEEALEGIKIRERRQAFGALFYTCEALQQIRDFNARVIVKERQLTQDLRNILQSDSKIK